MSLYRTCSNCGANIDFGERCECEKINNKKNAKGYITIEQKTGQLMFLNPTQGKRERGNFDY